MTASGLEGRIINPSELKETLIGFWQELQEGHGHLESPFLSYEYVKATAEAGCDSRICLLSRAGRAVGFFPFQFSSASHRRLGVGERVGSVMTDYFGVIAEPGIELHPGELLKLAGLNYVAVSHLDEGQSLYGLKGEQSDLSPRILLDQGEETYFEALHGRRRKFLEHTRRCQRKLVRDHGELRLEFDEPRSDSMLDRVIDLKRQQYQLTGAVDVLADPLRRRLLRVLAESRCENNRGVLSSLYAGDQWVSSQFNLLGNGVLHYWFPVYDPELSRYSPGRLLTIELIRKAASLGLKCIDLGAGTSQAKRQLANDQREVSKGEWYRPCLSSFAFRAMQSLRWHLSRTTK